MGLLDKAKEAAENASKKIGPMAANAKEKAGPLLDKVGDKAGELSQKEGIVGKVAGSVDKAVDKVRSDDSAPGSAALAADMGGLAGPGSAPSLDDPLPGEGLVDPADITPVVPLDPASTGPSLIGDLVDPVGDSTATTSGFPEPVVGSGFPDPSSVGTGDETDPIAVAAEVAAAGAVSDPFGTPADPAGVAGLADPAPGDEARPSI